MKVKGELLPSLNAPTGTGQETSEMIVGHSWSTPSQLYLYFPPMNKRMISSSIRVLLVIAQLWSFDLVQISWADLPNKRSGTLIFSDDFKQFDLSVWKHEITLGGGG